MEAPSAAPAITASSILPPSLPPPFDLGLPAPFPDPSLSPNSSEVYGFVLWLSSLLCFLLFLLWAYTPPAYLHSLSLTYYPSHWWGLALPSYISLLPLFLITFYVAYNLHSTLPLTHPATLIDSHTRYPPPTHHPIPASVTPRYSIPDLYDMPLVTVNAYLYGTREERREGRKARGGISER